MVCFFNRIVSHRKKYSSLPVVGSPRIEGWLDRLLKYVPERSLKLGLILHILGLEMVSSDRL